ncbi:MAG: tetratricopeptide repeat protein [Alphaproteobacteria bacterium]
MGDEHDELVKKAKDRDELGRLAYSLALRHYRAGDYAKAVISFQHAASAGHEEARTLFKGAPLSWFYSWWIGVNLDKIIAGAQLGARGGSAPDQCALGLIYRFGFGTEPDPALAFSWFEKAAGAGDVEANLQLGSMCLGDSGGEAKNEKRALGCFLRAAEQGNATAQLLAANLYFIGGDGVPIDRVESFVWRVMYARHSPAGSNAWKNVESDKLLLKPEQLTAAEKRLQKFG